jgi:manganese transport protein
MSGNCTWLLPPLECLPAYSAVRALKQFLTRTFELAPRFIGPVHTSHSSRGKPMNSSDVSASAWHPAPRWSWRRLGSFVGPGYLVAVGYMDPGNWATDIAGGSAFGYKLLPIVAISSAVAMFLQWLSLRLGIASGQDLAQLCRLRFGPRASWFFWIASEVAIVACDLAEVIGTAIALNLLFGIPLPAGVLITAANTFLILGLERRGFRYIEGLVITLTGVIGVCFLFEIFCSGPSGIEIGRSIVPPASLFRDPGALYVALGIFGATVMPHNLYLHSSLVRRRLENDSIGCKREAISLSSIDCFSALSVAFLINAAILVLAASAFYASGHTGVTGISEAYKLLTPMFGPAAAVIFGIALLAAGQNSTVTGTMAGQITMEGFLGLRMKLVWRRLLTRGLALIPAMIVAVLAGERGTDKLLIGSQVVLSMQLGFAVLPLVLFTSDKRIMGSFANGRVTTAIAYCLAAAIILANAWLVAQVF